MYLYVVSLYIPHDTMYVCSDIQVQYYPNLSICQRESWRLEPRAASPLARAVRLDPIPREGHLSCYGRTLPCNPLLDHRRINIYSHGGKPVSPQDYQAGPCHPRVCA